MKSFVKSLLNNLMLVIAALTSSLTLAMTIYNTVKGRERLTFVGTHLAGYYSKKFRSESGKMVVVDIIMNNPTSTDIVITNIELKIGNLSFKHYEYELDALLSDPIEMDYILFNPQITLPFKIEPHSSTKCSLPFFIPDNKRIDFNKKTLLYLSTHSSTNKYKIKDVIYYDAHPFN